MTSRTINRANFPDGTRPSGSNQIKRTITLTVKLSNFYPINKSDCQPSFNHVLLYHCQEINCVQCTLTFYFRIPRAYLINGVWTKHPRNTTWRPESLHVSGWQMRLCGTTWWLEWAIILETTPGMM